MLLATALVTAQRRAGTWSIIPRVGVNIANVTGFEVYILNHQDAQDVSTPSITSKFREGFAGGTELQYQINRIYAASAGAFYSVQGFRLPDYEDVTADNTHYGTSRYRCTTDYINLPLMLHGYIARGLSVNIGLQAGFRLSAKLRATVSNFTVDKEGKAHYLTNERGELVYALNTETDITSRTKAVELSIPIGLSYEFSNVVLDARYNLGITRAMTIADEGYRNKWLMFTVGYQFDL